jgi:hypothetical protein
MTGAGTFIAIRGPKAHVTLSMTGPWLRSGKGVFFPMTFRTSPQLVGTYFRLFVNRRAFTVQSARRHPESGRHYYYRATDRKSGAGLSLTAETLRRHLEGEITIPR